jgi:fructosamine-3-kinase
VIALDDRLVEPDRPALLHGDLRTGNVRSSRIRVRSSLDPACYHGYPEVELAYAARMGTLGEPLFARYRALRDLGY